MTNLVTSLMPKFDQQLRCGMRRRTILSLVAFADISGGTDVSEAYTVLTVAGGERMNL